MAIAPWGVQAAGLGKLTVFSGLGQPLRAELNVTASKDELFGMTARLAHRETFKQAGVDYTSVLQDLRFTLEKKANGDSVVKLSSVRPVNEPFVDFLLELDWPGGRLVREYTFLLDPPEVMEQTGGRSVVDAKVIELARVSSAPEIRPLKPAAQPVKAAPVQVADERKPTGEAAASRMVKRGESLVQIASENRIPGVTLEQMLMALLRANPNAFVGQNINRLKEGAILAIPQKEEVEAIPRDEAKRTYTAQARDWLSYRQKLAAATAAAPVRQDSAGAQSSSGKIVAKVEEKALPAEKSKDQVKVARTDAPKGSEALKSAAQEEDRIARDKAYREAQERLVALEKNVSDLQKLLEMKNQKLAELQQSASAAKQPANPAPAAVAPPVAQPAVAPKSVEPVKVAEAPKTEQPKPEEVKAVPAKVVEPETATAPVPAPAQAVPAAEVKPEAEKPAQAAVAPKPPKVVTPPPPPPPEPDFIDSLLDDPVMLFGGAGGLLALLGLGGFLAYRRRGIQSSPPQISTAPVPSSIGPNSVFRMTGGQSVDTANIPLQTADFSQTGVGMIDTDEVDPVAEADVYIAYGRDTQAEEILLDALNKDPQRTAIHAKLLEIYAARGSLKQFETLASELYAQTDGQGPDWLKVSELGAKLDPENPLYFTAGQVPRAIEPAAVPAMAESDFFASSSAAPVEPAFSVPDTFAVPEPLVPPAADAESEHSFDKSTQILQPAAPAQELPEVPVEPAPSAVNMMTLDFDLGKPEVPAASAAANKTPVKADASHDVITLDFDLGTNSTVNPAQDASPALAFDLNLASGALNSAPEPDFSAEGTMIMPDPVNVMDAGFDLGALDLAKEASAPVLSKAPVAAEPSTGGGSLDFDFDLALTPAGQGPTAEPVKSVAPPDDPAATLIAGNIAAIESSDDQKSALLGESDADGLNFDVDLGASMFMTQGVDMRKFDMAGISLDLNDQPNQAQPEVSFEEPPPVRSAAWEEANTKLDLAKAYEEMGDADGAIELLREVKAEAPSDLAEQAKAMLARLGA